MSPASALGYRMAVESEEERIRQCNDLSRQILSQRRNVKRLYEFSVPTPEQILDPLGVTDSTGPVRLDYTGQPTTVNYPATAYKRCRVKRKMHEATELWITPIVSQVEKSHVDAVIPSVAIIDFDDKWLLLGKYPVPRGLRDNCVNIKRFRVAFALGLHHLVYHGFFFKRGCQPATIFLLRNMQSRIQIERKLPILVLYTLCEFYTGLGYLRLERKDEVGMFKSETLYSVANTLRDSLSRDQIRELAVLFT